MIEALFNPIVKVSKDKDTGEPNGKYPPTFKAKVPQMNKNWDVRVFNTEKKQYMINDVESGDNLEDVFVKFCKVRAIVQCVGLWVASGNFMCQWKLVKAEVDVPGNALAHDFLPDSGDEDADREDLLAEVERTMLDLVQDVVTQANHIGGDFRAPGIKAECKALMLQIVRDMR